jgi:hypothetical protein
VLGIFTIPVQKRSTTEQVILLLTIISLITINKESSIIRPFSGYLTILGLRLASFLSLAKRLGILFSG